MTKREITETIREYDESGRLVRETVTTTSETDDTVYTPTNPWWSTQPYIYTNPCTCTCDATTASSHGPADNTTVTLHN